MVRTKVCLLLLWLCCYPIYAQPVGARNKYKLARSQAEEGNWKQAVLFCNEALKDAPNYLDALYLRGLSNFALEKYEEAETDLKNRYRKGSRILPCLPTTGEPLSDPGTF